MFPYPIHFLGNPSRPIQTLSTYLGTLLGQQHLISLFHQHLPQHTSIYPERNVSLRYHFDIDDDAIGTQILPAVFIVDVLKLF